MILYVRDRNAWAMTAQRPVIIYLKVICVLFGTTARQDSQSRHLLRSGAMKYLAWKRLRRRMKYGSESDAGRTFKQGLLSKIAFVLSML
jgi:hypothetical protein